jgi:iron(3+)-hydroxamate import system permease protein FhuB
VSIEDTRVRSEIRGGKPFLPLLFLGTGLLLLFVWLSVFYGLRGTAESVSRILWFVRVPRTAAALLCGAALSTAGYLMQEALHNALASPSIMGVNAGAGLFALLAALLFPFAIGARFVLAFLGALLSIALVLLIAKRAGYSRTVIVLSGVAVSALMGAAVNGIVSFFPNAVADKQAFTLGGFVGVSYAGLAFAAVFILPALLFGTFLAGGIDLFALGDEIAQGLGLHVTRHRLLTLLTATVLAAAAVSIGGLIGFIGLIVPNVMRRVFPGQLPARKMLLLSALYGSVLLTAADFLARRLFYPYELPVGLLLSLLGAPFFIWMLMHRKRGV